MPKFTGTIRELEYYDYYWEVVAENSEEAKQKILNGEGKILSKRFVEASDLHPRDEAVYDIKES